MYILDTSIIIDALHNNREAHQRIQDLSESVHTTVISIGELMLGIHRVNMNQKERKLLAVNDFISRLDGVYNVDGAVAAQFGQLKARLFEAGKIIGDNDTWIAAICLVHDATLVTANKRYFEVVPGLQIA